MNYETMTFESLANHCAKYSGGKLEETKLLLLFLHSKKVVEEFPKMLKEEADNLSKFCFIQSGYNLNKADMECRLTHLFEQTIV